MPSELLARSPEYDAILPMFMHPIVTDAAEVADGVPATPWPSAPVPALPCFMPAPEAAAQPRHHSRGRRSRCSPSPTAPPALWRAGPSRPGAAARPGRRLRRRPGRSRAPVLGDSRWGDPAVLEDHVEGARASSALPARAIATRAEAEARGAGAGRAAGAQDRTGQRSPQTQGGAAGPGAGRGRPRPRPSTLWTRASAKATAGWCSVWSPAGWRCSSRSCAIPIWAASWGLGRGGSAVERGEPPRWLSLPATADQAEAFFADCTSCASWAIPEDPAARAVRALVESMARSPTPPPTSRWPRSTPPSGIPTRSPVVGGRRAGRWRRRDRGRRRTTREGPGLGGGFPFPGTGRAAGCGTRPHRNRSLPPRWCRGGSPPPASPRPDRSRLPRTWW